MNADDTPIRVEVLLLDAQMPRALSLLRRLKIGVTELQLEPRRTVRLTLEGCEAKIDRFNRNFGGAPAEVSLS